MKEGVVVWTKNRRERLFGGMTGTQAKKPYLTRKGNHVCGQAGAVPTTGRFKAAVFDGQVSQSAWGAMQMEPVPEWTRTGGRVDAAL